MPRRMHPTFSFETSNAPDWYGDVRLCRTGLNPHFLFVLPKRLPGFPAELYRFGTEKPGGYSLLKRECPPGPPKEKRGGISISPRTPLKRHKGAKLRFLPFGNPSEDEGERQRGEEQRVSSLRPNECHARKCGDALRSFGYFQRSRQKTSDFCRQFVPTAPSYG